MSAGTRWFYKERQKEKHNFNFLLLRSSSSSRQESKTFRLFICHITNSQSVKIIGPPANHPVVASTGPWPGFTLCLTWFLLREQTDSPFNAFRQLLRLGTRVWFTGQRAIFSHWWVKSLLGVLSAVNYKANKPSSARSYLKRQHVWLFRHLRWNELETKSKTHVSYFIYKGLWESSVSSENPLCPRGDKTWYVLKTWIFFFLNCAQLNQCF